MKKLATRALLLLILIGTVAPATRAAAVIPASASTAAPATSEPDPEAVKAAMNDFKHLSRSERRSRLKDVKKLVKEYRAAKRDGMDPDVKLLLLAILAILLPPLAVLIKEEELNVKFWISLLLLLLTIIAWPLWLISVGYALLVVFDVL